jgi:pyrroloquinoline-quinone synthase
LSTLNGMRESGQGTRNASEVGLCARLDAERRACDVLTHPFYLRWTAGTLTAEDLALYAAQYRHAVVALARASAHAAAAAPELARPELEAHAQEELEHVALWEAFAAAVDAPAAPPSPETAACAHAWAGEDGRSYPAWLATLYAIEAGQPKIAGTKADGLRRHYGIEGDAAAYFTLHAERDKQHVAELKCLLATELPRAEPAELVAATRAVLQGNWLLLDGVERSA